MDRYFAETKSVMGLPGSEPPVLRRSSAGVAETSLAYSSNKNCTVTFKECAEWPEVSYTVRKGSDIYLGWPSEEFGENGIYASDFPDKTFKLGANGGYAGDKQLVGWKIGGSVQPVGAYVKVIDDFEVVPVWETI